MVCRFRVNTIQQAKAETLENASMSGYIDLRRLEFDRENLLAFQRRAAYLLPSLKEISLVEHNWFNELGQDDRQS